MSDELRGESATEFNRRETSQTVIVICPLEHENSVGEILYGCGEEFVTNEDEDGYEECPQCGLTFEKKESA